LIPNGPSKVRRMEPEKKEEKKLHRLLIKCRLEGDEPVRSKRFVFTLTVQNIGDDVFPGGRFSRIELECTGLGLVTHMADTRLPTIPKLGKGETTELTGMHLAPAAEGSSWLIGEVQSDDQRSVRHYLTERIDAGDVWRWAIYVRRLDDFRIISLLEKIVALLEKK